jgi:hypothetical protein
MAGMVNCRYCGESFAPQPGKPGYIDECPACLHAKTHPRPPVDVVVQLMQRSDEARKAIEALRRSLLKIGIAESEVDERLEWLLTVDPRKIV